jgi:eukaryotic-like serine/threonine-protein kinase
MTLKLTAASFLNGVRNSGLVEAEPLESVIREMRGAGGDVNDSRTIASELVQREFLTEWQADKLLQGRHKGFFLGRYRLMRLLGTGQMSAVYLGRHIYMDHLVAIKVLPADKVGDTSYLGRFYREAKAVAALSHQNIIRAFDVDKQVEAGTDIHFLVMEYIEGKQLTHLINGAGDQKLDLVTVADVIRQAAEGLAHAHAKNMVHRDIKPDNLLVTPEGEVKILDLGLARFFKTTDEESLTLKHDERVIGTADYLAPEQAIDSHSVDSRADIYGLGCTFYCALTGHPPFTEGTLVQRLMAHQSQPAPPVTNERPDVPETLTKILDRTLAKKREDRYQTGRELADALTSWLFENAPHEWKEKRLPMYAALRLKNLLNNPQKPVHAEPSVESADAPSPKAASSVTTKKLSDSDDVSVPAVASKAKSFITPKPPTVSKPSSSEAAKVVAEKNAKSGSSAANLASMRSLMKAKPKEPQSVVAIARRHPAAAVVVSVLATAILIAAGVYFLRPPQPASANDRSQATTESPKTAQAEIANAK